VSDTCPQRDFFLRMETSSKSKLNLRVERFLDLILGTKIITPTTDESAMYAAASAASGSACLSRQVGAAVTDRNGSVLSVGWNDVPKALGGLYYTDHENDPQGTKDLRCYNKGGGSCFNDEEKALLARSLIETLGEDIIPSNKKNLAIERVEKNKSIKGLIEFSRAIHAEMHAILTALRVGGDRVLGGSIYVTTYPCHACARHIIAAGIANVFYIEPYKKSLAIKLHDDAITEDESDNKLVRLLPYEGVAPTRYLSIFKMLPNSRKSNGKLIQIASKNSRPRAEKSLQSMPELESMVVKSLVERGLIAALSSAT
jgi:deoxycytidylate deaminase